MERHREILINVRTRNRIYFLIFIVPIVCINMYYNKIVRKLVERNTYNMIDTYCLNK